MAVHDETYGKIKYIYEFYAGEKSSFLNKAEKFGIKYKNGLDMLFYSALASQKIWLGEETYGKLNINSIENLKEQILKI